MNTITSWMIILLIILSSAVLSPAKGKTVDGVITPSATLTIKSLIEAEYGEKTVVCPHAVHKNIKRLTPCAMGYRAVIGRNRVIITHMWPARTIEEFQRRAKLEPLEKEGSDKSTVVVVPVPATEVAPLAVDETKTLLEAQVKKLEAEKESLTNQLAEAKAKLEESEKAVETVKTESQEFAQTVASLKEENQKLQAQLETAINNRPEAEVKFIEVMPMWTKILIGLIFVALVICIIKIRGARQDLAQSNIEIARLHGNLLTQVGERFVAEAGEAGQASRDDDFIKLRPPPGVVPECTWLQGGPPPAPPTPPTS